MPRSKHMSTSSSQLKYGETVHKGIAQINNYLCSSGRDLKIYVKKVAQFYIVYHFLMNKKSMTKLMCTVFLFQMERPVII
jgi:hypothetical protein